VAATFWARHLPTCGRSTPNGDITMMEWKKSIALGLLAATAMAACKKDNSESSAGGTLDTTSVVKPATDSLLLTPAPVVAKWSSPIVLGFATEANTGEVELGKLGEK